MVLRRGEWGSWLEETRACEGTDKIAEYRVFKHFKRVNKAKAWNRRGAGFLLEAEERKAREVEG